MKITLFPDLHARTKTELDLSWSELCAMLADPPVAASKDALPLLKLAVFGDKRTGKGSLRHDANMLEIHGIEADYDAGELSVAEAIIALERHGVRALIYSSPSHTSERPRWRVLCPLSRAQPPSARSVLMARLNGALGGILAGESFTLSQSFYYGRIEGRPYLVATTFDDPSKGHFIDELDGLDDIAVGTPAPPPDAPLAAGASRAPAAAQAQALVATLGRKLRTGDGRRELIKTYVASRSARGLEPFEIRRLVQAFAETFFDPSDPLDAANIDDIIEWATSRDAAQALRAPVAGFPASADTSISPGAGNPPEGLKTDLRSKLLDLSEPLPDYGAIPHLIDPWIPCGEVTLLAGHGGGGKSYVALLLAVHVALGRAIGLLPTQQANVLLFSAEDNRRALTIRLRKICNLMGIAPAELAGKLHLLDASDIDPTLYQPRRYTVAGEQITLYDTPLVADLKALADECGAGLVIIDNSSDVYNGDEIRRAEVRGFVRSLRQHLASEDRAVLLLTHVNKAAANTKSEVEDYSGSTAWHNSVRSRLSLIPDDTGLTVKHLKASHAVRAEPVRFEWVDGVPVVAGTQNGGAEAAQALRDAAERADRAAVVKLINEFNTRGEIVSTSVTANNSAFKMLRAEKTFPKGIKKAEQLAALLRAAERAGELRRETYQDAYRMLRERWVTVDVPHATAEVEEASECPF